MIVPGHIYRRAQNVWDIFFDWQGSKLDERYASRARELRAESAPPFSSDAPTQRAAIVSEGTNEPRIEYLSPDEGQYVFNFCVFHQINATDPDRAIEILRWVLAKERKKRSDDMMLALLDELHAELWLANPNWLATRLAICMGVTPEAPMLNEGQFRRLYREIRVAVDQAKRAPSLDSWWYQQYRIAPRILLAKRHCVTVGKEEGGKYFRFLEEIQADVGSYRNLTMSSWLSGSARPVLHSIFFHPFGRGDPKEVCREGAMRSELPIFWYDAVLQAEAAILRIQHAVLFEKVPIESVLGDAANVLPDCIDAFSPHLLAALMTLEDGKLTL